MRRYTMHSAASLGFDWTMLNMARCSVFGRSSFLLYARAQFSPVCVQAQYRKPEPQFLLKKAVTCRRVQCDSASQPLSSMPPARLSLRSDGTLNASKCQPMGGYVVIARDCSERDEMAESGCSPEQVRSECGRAGPSSAPPSRSTCGGVPCCIPLTATCELARTIDHWRCDSSVWCTAE